jgi:hypothetical protein
MAQVEQGFALYVWRQNRDSPWRVTDWRGVPQPLDTISDVGRVELIRARRPPDPVPKAISDD